MDDLGIGEGQVDELERGMPTTKIGSDDGSPLTDFAAIGAGVKARSMWRNIASVAPSSYLVCARSAALPAAR